MSVIFVGMFVVVGLVLCCDFNRDGFFRRLFEFRRNVVDLARGVVMRERDFIVCMLLVKILNRFIEIVMVELVDMF